MCPIPGLAVVGATGRNCGTADAYDVPEGRPGPDLDDPGQPDSHPDAEVLATTPAPASTPGVVAGSCVPGHFCTYYS